MTYRTLMKQNSVADTSNYDQIIYLYVNNEKEGTIYYYRSHNAIENIRYVIFFSTVHNKITHGTMKSDVYMLKLVMSSGRTLVC